MGFIWEMLHRSLPLFTEYVLDFSGEQSMWWFPPLHRFQLPIIVKTYAYAYVWDNGREISCFRNWDNVKRASKLYKRIILIVPFHISCQISNPSQYKGHVITNSEFLKVQITFGSIPMPIITCLTVVNVLRFGALFLG